MPRGLDELQLFYLDDDSTVVGGVNERSHKSLHERFSGSGWDSRFAIFGSSDLHRGCGGSYASC